MRLIRLPSEMSLWSQQARAAGQTIGLVPTMGCFHEGHLSLMRRAATLADMVVVSLFVNPIQFGPEEDYSRYPRDFERDAAMAAAEKIDILFAPQPEEMFAPDNLTRIEVSGLTDVLCGKSRPGHFTGVATVVAKLFNLTMPQIAVFGEKDFQQLAVLKRMVQDLDFQLKIIGHPIVREADGLAMSSRNRYLSREERRSALSLHQAIQLSRSAVREGITDVDQLLDLVTARLQQDARITTDYIAIVDQYDLTPKKRIDPNALLAMAVKIGTTRLIDNALLLV